MANFLKKIISLLTKLDKNVKALIVMFFDIFVVFGSWVLFIIFPAIIISGFKYNLLDYFLQDYTLSFFIPITGYVCCMLFLNAYREVYRSFTLNNIYPIFYSFSFFFFCMLLVNIFVLNVDSFISSLIQSFSVSATAFLFIVVSRIIFRSISNLTQKKYTKSIYIFGVGSAARELFASISQNTKLEIKAFVTDNNDLIGREIFTKNIISIDQAKRLWHQDNNCSLYIASRSIKDDQKKMLIDLCVSLVVKVKKISPFSEMLKEREVSLTDLTISDLLPRKSLDEFDNEIEGISDSCVLVTGAGGSIGSEISRILARGGVKKIILVDISEPSLFSISEEVKEINKNSKTFSVLLSVKNKLSLKEVFLKYKPDIVYHAAAYKHVPILEEDDNYAQAFKNNFFGTCNVADICVEANVTKCIFVSTDKAVRPTNLMGASKRMAELYLDSISDNANTIFSSVRFGNVIDSSGSVIPTFRKQIKLGGPVTVTHPDIIRYFMTIGEAAYLVILASILSKKGEVYMLKMGEPVKILDIAERLIKLSGNEIKTQDNEDGIEIIYTGLRPGEKLFEELLVDENDVRTDHPKIFIDTNRKKISKAKILEIKSRIENFLDSKDKSGLISLLKEYVDYQIK